MIQVFVIMIDNSDHIDRFAFLSKKEAEKYIKKQIELYGSQCKYNEAWVEEVWVYKTYEDYTMRQYCKNCGTAIGIVNISKTEIFEFCSFKCEDEYEAEIDKREEQETNGH